MTCSISWKIKARQCFSPFGVTTAVMNSSALQLLISIEVSLSSQIAVKNASFVLFGEPWWKTGRTCFPSSPFWNCAIQLGNFRSCKNWYFRALKSQKKCQQPFLINNAKNFCLQRNQFLYPLTVVWP